MLREIRPVLDPLLLDVLPGCDDGHAQVGVEVSGKGDRPESDVGLSHADFVGQVGHPLPLEDVVDRYHPLQLLFRLRMRSGTVARTSEHRSHVQKLTSEVEGDGHTCPADSARSRNQRSNQSMKRDSSSGSDEHNCSRRAWRAFSFSETTVALSAYCCQNRGDRSRTRSQSCTAHIRIRYRSTTDSS